MKISLRLIGTVLALGLLLAGCRQQPESDAGASAPAVGSPPAESAPAAPDTRQPEDGGAHDGAFTPDWETRPFTTGPFSMELPKGWDEVPEMGGYTAIFFTDSARDIETQPSNVVMEISPDALSDDGAPEIDYTDSEIQEEFFQFLKENAESRMGELVNSETELWERPLTFILSYDRERDNGTVRRTCYYPVEPQYHSMVIYATDFGDDIQPELSEVVRHMLDTWHSALADGE